MLITRFHDTETLQVSVEFLTPTFLGGADQNAELRAAPFKNLLRQWWRVAVGSQYPNHKEMLKAEGDLFGSVLDDSKASASKVRLELRPGDDFRIDQSGLNFGQTPHPEVRAKSVSNALYLGYGPVSTHGVKTYIAPDSKAELTLCLPKNCVPELLLVLAYIDAFGTLGSRCRNGWGSIVLSGQNFRRQAAATLPAQDWQPQVNGGQARAYPAHLGRDQRGLLCWEVNPAPKTWKTAMQELATIYMNLRTSTNIAPNGLQKRHILGYPVTNHPIDTWGKKDGRMPSQLRLMVKRNEENHLVGRILHLPHRLPKQWEPQRLGQETEVWQAIHQRLDKNTDLRRCGGTR